MGINDNLDVRHISAHLAQKALLMISPSMSKWQAELVRGGGRVKFVDMDGGAM